MLFGIIGSKQSGKSTFVSSISKKYRIIEYSFAEPLKRICGVLGVEHKYMYEQEFKEQIIPEFGISARELLQVLGTDIFREIVPNHLPNFTLTQNGDIWINLFKKRYQEIQKVDKTAIVIISDVRFPNELKAISEMNGVLIKIERPCVKNNVFSSHSSEKGVKDLKGDYEIVNDFENVNDYENQCLETFELVRRIHKENS